ncbi:MAG: Peptidase S8/S53 subtilisin kexin sedolisin [Bacteroidetes bacterium]|nr:MAG: Peptidase S8/S53 subtilisin kexin sedolisin [Bacteroidota bacterium]
MKKMYLFILAMLSIGQGFAQAEFNTGSMFVNVNTYGRIRLYSQDEVIHLQRASILVGTSSTAVFDYNNDSETLDPTVLVPAPTWGDFEIYGSYDNTYSNLPPDVIVKLNAYGWTNKSFTVIKFNVKNDESTAITASIGLDLIPQLAEEYGFDTVTYNATEGVVRFHRGAGVNMGLKLLSTSMSSLFSFEWFEDYFTDANYWGWMTTGSLQPRYTSATVDGPVTVTSQAPVVLNPGESVDVFYAFALGANEQAMLAGLTEASQKYDDLFAGLGDINANPNAVRLGKNFPNPFNGSTTISYNLPSSGLVSLKVFDQLGNEVVVLVQEEQSTGVHRMEFDAAKLAPGVYYYTLIFDNSRITNKMIITE